MRVLVTGGAGFIGSHVLEQLRHVGHDIIVVDDLTAGLAGNVLINELLQRDIVRDGWQQEVEALGGLPEVVIHLAAKTSVPVSQQYPAWFMDTNNLGTLRVLAAARQWGARVVFASSAAVYGPLEGPDRSSVEDDPTRPNNIYGVTKLTGEGLCASFPDVATAVFRFFNVYGPRQRADHTYASVIPKFHEALLRGQPLTVHGDGRQVRDFVYVEDVARIVAAAAITFTQHGPVNVASGNAITIVGLVDRMRHITGIDVSVVAGDGDPGALYSGADRDLFTSLYPDIITMTDLSVGLEKTWAWHQRTLGGRLAA